MCKALLVYTDGPNEQLGEKKKGHDTLWVRPEPVDWGAEHTDDEVYLCIEDVYAQVAPGIQKITPVAFRARANVVVDIVMPADIESADDETVWLIHRGFVPCYEQPQSHALAEHLRP